MTDPIAVTLSRQFRDALRQQETAAVNAMRDAWLSVGAALSAEIEALADSIDGTPTPTQLARLDRYNALLAQVGQQLDAYMPTAEAAIAAAQRTVAGEAALQAAELIRLAGYDGSFDTLPVGAVENLLGVARTGQPLGNLLQAAYLHTADGISADLIAGLALGRNGRTIARSVVNNGLARGFNHVALVARDQINRASRLASQQAYAASGVVTRYQRISAQDNRVCAACMMLSGRIYDLEVDFINHAQCRCSLTPVVESIGPLLPKTYGRDWFMAQSAETQRAILRPGVYDLWKETGFDLERVVTYRDSATWGRSAMPTALKRLAVVAD